jgi:hypothetical protein
VQLGSSRDSLLSADGRPFGSVCTETVQSVPTQLKGVKVILARNQNLESLVPLRNGDGQLRRNLYSSGGGIATGVLAGPCCFIGVIRQVIEYLQDRLVVEESEHEFVDTNLALHEANLLPKAVESALMERELVP